MPRCSLVIPAYNESDAILSTLKRIEECVLIDFECLVVVDFQEDSTLTAIKNSNLNSSRFKVLVNSSGRGPAEAIKFGIRSSSAEVVVVTMADGSDDPQDIPELVRLVERGVVVASASRYMAGGQQIGAPLIKGCLSKVAGKTLYFFGRVGTHDATNNFKAYSKKFLTESAIESKFGFEIGLELTAKAKRRSLPVAELPTIWLEQNYRKSNFRLAAWIPKYLRWYLYAFGIGKGENRE
jgi:glycosyltransferase involved in cell wall biosynthesis